MKVKVDHQLKLMGFGKKNFQGLRRDAARHACKHFIYVVSFIYILISFSLLKPSMASSSLQSLRVKNMKHIYNKQPPPPASPRYSDEEKEAAKTDPVLGKKRAREKKRRAATRAKYQVVR
jgi:hypothetical protein